MVRAAYMPLPGQTISTRRFGQPDKSFVARRNVLSSIERLLDHGDGAVCASFEWISLNDVWQNLPSGHAGKQN